MCPDLVVTREMLVKKVDVCQRLLKVLDKIQPGLMIDRGEVV